MSNFNFHVPDYWWKLTMCVAAMCGICTILNILSRQYKDALLWGCLTMSNLEIATYEQRDSNHDAN